MSGERTLRGGRIVAVVGAVLLVVLVGSRALASLYVDALWHAETGYGSVFWTRFTWIWGIRAAAAALVGVALYLNLSRVGASLGTVHIRRKFGNLEIAERLPTRYVTAAAVGLSVLLGLWFGASVPDSVGRSALLLQAAEPWGATDPVLGRDLGFYVFALPLLRAAVTFAMVVTFLIFTIATAGYATTGVLRMGEGGMVMTEGARKHLGTLMGVFLLLVAARLAMGRPLLLLYGNSDVQGIFGYTDASARLPALRIQAVLALLGAGGVFWGAWRNRLLPAISGIGVTVVGLLVVGQLYPSVVQRFQVVPNELSRETPWIEVNLERTRLAYGLHDLERGPYQARTEGAVDWDEATRQFDGLPVWSPGALLTTFREVEARFRYYHFPSVAFDRYAYGATAPAEADRLPVALAVREVDPAGIEDPNWQNLHVRERYVVGNGAVAVDATRRTPEGRPLTLLSGLPPDTSSGAPAALALARPSVFFGSRSQPYALVTPTDSTYQGPAGGPGEPGVDFPRGIAVGSLPRKLVLAWYLRESNLLFASEVTPESRLVLHRGVLQRVRRIAPFLTFPEAPYAVVADGRVTWILEAFTTTRFFPLASTTSLEFGRAVSYARNSVKVTVDAVTGEVAFYAVPVDDPLRDAIGAAFPGMIRPLDEMPPELRRHLRYSRALMALQSSVLLQYHQETPATFFGQQDVWAVPNELAQGTSPVTYQPEYGILRLPGDSVADFRLVTSFVPAGRQNLTGLLAGELDGAGRPRLRLFDVPVENQVPGPRQIEALVEQDPEISQQFSLWRTGGSRVWTGHLHVVPVGDRTVYMEPVFLAAEEDAIPELRRFVVSDGQRVAMEETLAGAVAALAGTSVGSDPTQTSRSPTGDLPTPGVTWSDEALGLLDRAEERLRQGDWAGFGAALDELRELLRQGGGNAGAGAGGR